MSDCRFFSPDVGGNAQQDGTLYQSKLTMTPSDLKDIKEHLTSEYLLIPRNRVYHALAGACAGIAVAFGVGAGGVLAYLKSEPANKARNHILSMEQEIAQHLSGLKADTYLRKDERYFIKSAISDLDLHVDGASSAKMMRIIQNHREGPQSWILQPASK